MKRIDSFFKKWDTPNKKGSQKRIILAIMPLEQLSDGLIHGKGWGDHKECIHRLLSCLLYGTSKKNKANKPKLAQRK